MNEDYLAYWGISKPPFSLTPDPDMLYLSTQHSECLMRLKYAIFSHKGGALLVSDNAGNGKTSILVRLQKELQEYYSGRVRVVFIDHPTLTPIEMIGEIARQLGGEMNTTEKIRSLNFLRDRLFALYNENIKVVVIVDEGQMLKERPDILQELRILLNFCVSDAFLLTFIFSGQKPLDSVLREMPEFWQRLPVRFFLKNLDFNDTRSLIQFRLRKVGATEDIFTNDAFEGIYNYSEGCPRIVCSLADLCLLVGYAKRARRIGFVEVSAACRDMESSGDSFPYFAYIQGQDSPVHEPDTIPASPMPKRVKSPATPEASPHHAPAGNETLCPKCSKPNVVTSTFCGKCGAPLRRKCPKCGVLQNIAHTECPACHADMDAELLALTGRLHTELAPYDIFEGNHDVWLQANGIELEDGETVLIAFPRGNLFTSGASLLQTGTDETVRKACDFILTNRRFILRADGNLIAGDLAHVETCIVSDTGKVLWKKPMLTLGTQKGIHTVQLPHGGDCGKAVSTLMAAYIQAVMLK